MKKNSLALVLFASSLATPLFASNFISHFVPSEKQAKHAVNLNAKNALVTNKTTYPNFTGEWVGSCAGNDDPISIKNDEFAFTLDGEEFVIGSMTTHSTSSPYESSVGNTSANWSPDMTKMVLDFNDTSRNFVDINAKGFDTEMGQLTFSLSNDELQVNGQVMMLSNMVKVNDFPVSCTLHRK